MTKIIVPSPADPVTLASELEQRLDDDIITTRHSVRFQVNRGSGKEDTLDVDDADIVELEMEDGQRLWMRVEDLQSEFGLSLDRSGQDVRDGVVRIPTALSMNGTTRGLGKWVIKGLKIIGVDIAGSITDFVKGKVEGKLSPGPGLYRCSASSAATLQPVTRVDRSKPILVFLHGTASSTEGSFGALWESDSSLISDLLSHYGDQVLAFQHQTLSLSPIENALDLLKTLTALQNTVQGKHPLRLHLVSHSRGGLIGEILCRGTRTSGPSFDDSDINFFAADGYARDKKAIQELGSLLDRTDLHIEKYIRVACPARGTTLADGRFDRYLTGMVNIMEKVPGLANPVLDGVSSLMLAVVHKRTEPEEIPGIEAMMPSSPTIRMLNRPDVTVNADLHVIGGDVKASGIINRLKVIITDLFYREDHDLVVNTPSMFGGAAREKGVRYWVDTGAKVNHFRYFGNSSTATRLTAGLLQTDPAFHKLDTKPYEVNEDSYRKRTLDAQPIVFVIPGVMGSHLSVSGDRIWLDFKQIACGGVTKLDIDKRAPTVLPVKPLDDAYGELMKYLSASHDVRPFAYDWRVCIEETAELLSKQVELALEEAVSMDMPVRFIAHSMGGLVVRTMLASAHGQELWSRICEHPDARFIMLGTPNRGSHDIASMLIGRDSLTRKIALLDFKNNYAQLLKVIARFDGALQLLPHDGELDLYKVESWKLLHENDVPEKRGVFSTGVASKKSAGISWVIPDEAQLVNAARVRDLINSSRIDSERMIYVAGQAPATAVDITINDNAAKNKRVQVHATAEGDGRVPWSTGIPANLASRNVYYMDAAHGDLADTADAFPALKQLLEQGATHLLSNAPVVNRGNNKERFVLPVSKPDMYPDREDLVAAAMGGRRKIKRLPVGKCKVRIVHGNLARSRFPVAVGHYQGDSIVSAEGYLDRQLGGRLKERHRLGMYPGKKGSSIVMLNWPDNHELGRHTNPVHPGAIVVGMGTVGDLTPGTLTGTLVDGLMRYALEVRDTLVEKYRHQKLDLPETVNASLTSLLISSGNDLTVSDALRSILRAVSIVNDRLQRPSDEAIVSTDNSEKIPYVTIPELDIIEYWEDRAIQATRALVNLADTKDFDKHFEFHRQVAQGKDGRRRVSFDDSPGWWQRMRISTLATGDLRFETLTERARVESQLQSTQRILVDRFLSRAAATSTYDPQLGKTLFELLMPNQLKQYAPDRRNLILMLDDKAAVYPWELLQDSFDSSGRPMAVEAGIIRQLISGKFRPQPLMAQAQTALVVGDPVADNLDSNSFPPLPGAASEARKVAAQLNAAAYDTLELVGKDAKPLDVVTALYARAYRIVHIAAHGVFDLPVDENGRPIHINDNAKRESNSNVKRVSGVVLGDGIYLTPSEFEQMRNVPEFVFINCCHLGNLADSEDEKTVEYHRLAANVATQLIRMGVRAVIAAGWAVDDEAAKLFADRFYDRFLAGDSFGEAVTVARNASYTLEIRRNGNTWGAYQCYGDPDFALRATNTYTRSQNIDIPLSPSELKQNLDLLSIKAGYASEEDKKLINKQLEKIIRIIPNDWYESGSVCSAVATTYAELGNLTQAAEYYKKANKSATSDASIASVEQLVNMKARVAANKGSKIDATDDDISSALQELAEAEKIIDSLIDINESLERYSLKGSVHKRSVKLGNKSTQRSQLQKMEFAYSMAYDIGIETSQTNTYYPLQNRLAARIALSWCSGVKATTEKSSVKSDIKELQRNIDNTDMREASFWESCQIPDLLLLKALSNNKIISKSELPEIENAYKRARTRGSTEREFKSIEAHLRFFLIVAQTQLPKGKDETRNLCSTIKHILKTIGGNQ
ncbi:MAG: CHAT domain-containing protein [Granulosicoccus sp.]